MRRYVFTLPCMMIAACSQPAVIESNQAVIDERAQSLERAADSAVDQSIMQMARESAEETNASLADDSSR